jgi:hypothetical protein
MLSQAILKKSLCHSTPIAARQVVAKLGYSMNLLAFAGQTTMLSSTSENREASPCHFLKN